MRHAIFSRVLLVEGLLTGLGVAAATFYDGPLGMPWSTDGLVWQLPTPPAPPANARHLVSRNKREGGYCGRVISCDRWTSGPTGHYRAGGRDVRQISLRDWSRA